MGSYIYFPFGTITTAQRNAQMVRFAVNGKVCGKRNKGKKTSCPLGILSVLVVGISLLISDQRSLCYSLRELGKDIERGTNISLVTG